jgi:hypothetical protein
VPWKTKLLYALARMIRTSPRAVNQVRKLARYSSPENTILLDYPVYPSSRWDTLNPHPELLQILDMDRARYAEVLKSFLRFIPNFLTIKKSSDKRSLTDPFWVNGWMPGLDGVALYSFISLKKPRKYVEVGSGNSTKFAFKAKMEFSPKTEIISIDPRPRAEIDAICDQVIRKPLEEVDVRFFDNLSEDDILYVDNSHRVFMNSDTTVVFLDIIPRLQKGVLVEIHDINLPYDYPAEYLDRYYSEQYLLASYLLARGDRFAVILPSYFASHDGELKSILKPLWDSPQMDGVESHGCSFWLQIK